jgi:hypothetical protein
MSNRYVEVASQDEYQPSTFQTKNRAYYFPDYGTYTGQQFADDFTVSPKAVSWVPSLSEQYDYAEDVFTDDESDGYSAADYDDEDDESYQQSLLSSDSDYDDEYDYSDEFDYSDEYQADAPPYMASQHVSELLQMLNARMNYALVQNELLETTPVVEPVKQVNLPKVNFENVLAELQQKSEIKAQYTDAATEYRINKTAVNSLREEYIKTKAQDYKNSGVTGYFFKSAEPAVDRMAQIKEIESYAENISQYLDSVNCKAVRSTDLSDSVGMKRDQALFQQASNAIQWKVMQTFDMIGDSYRLLSATNSALYSSIQNLFGCKDMDQGALKQAESDFNSLNSKMAQQAKVDGRLSSIEDLEDVAENQSVAFSV